MDHAQVAHWLTAYERAWRTAGTDALDELFTPQAVYLPSPWAAPIEGRAAIAQFWDAERAGPDERFELHTDVVAVDGPVAVVRVEVAYVRPPSRWRNLWVIRIEPDGRCSAFEEWPFAPDQTDGHDATR